MSSGKSDESEYLTGQELLPPDQSRVIQQATFTYSLLGKALKRQIKGTEVQGRNCLKP